MPWGFEVVCYTIKDNKKSSPESNQEEVGRKAAVVNMQI